MYYVEQGSFQPLGHPNHIPAENYRVGFADGYNGRPPTIPQGKAAAVAYIEGFNQGQAAQPVK